MNYLLPLKKQLEFYRPPGTSTEEIKALLNMAQIFRAQLEEFLEKIHDDDPDHPFFMADEEMDLLTIMLTEFAEDIHTDTGLWKTIEVYHQKHFYTPLPLIGKPSDAPLHSFDPKRFQFFLYLRSSHFTLSETPISPHDNDLKSLANFTINYFTKAFAKLPHSSSIKSFLTSPSKDLESIRKKLFWIGTKSFLFQPAFEDYLYDLGPIDEEETCNIVGDFLQKPCPDCSGLSPIDVLAAYLHLSEEERSALKSWNEPHLAFYQIKSLNHRGSEVETLDVINLINNQPYRILVNIDKKSSPFYSENIIYGSLVPWQNQWHWDDLHASWKSAPPNFLELKNEFLCEYRSLFYHYRPDLEEKAQKITAENYKSFVQFYGSDLAVFSDGLSVAASEQKRRRETNIQHAVRKTLKDKHLKMKEMTHWDKNLLAQQTGMVCFFQEDIGIQMMDSYESFLSAVKKKNTKTLTEHEVEVLQEVIEREDLSPAFVRRLIKEHGNTWIKNLYLLSDEVTDIEYLLRRFKGIHYRKCYPRTFIQE